MVAGPVEQGGELAEAGRPRASQERGRFVVERQLQREQLDASIRSEQQAVEMDVRNAVQAVATELQRVIASRLARESAELQLEGEKKLYDVGRSTTFLLLERQQSLTTARTQELQAQTDLNKGLADLQRATSSTLRVNNVVVESPAKP